MVYGTYNYSIHGVYKPSYNWGAPHCILIINHSFTAFDLLQKRFSFAESLRLTPDTGVFPPGVCRESQEMVTMWGNDCLQDKQ